MSEILRFKKEAIKRGKLCESYHERWDKVKSRQDLIDMALDPNGAEFLCESIAAGWGVSPDFLKKTFNEYINGRYVRRIGGYTSELYVLFEGNILLASTFLIVISSKVNIEIPKKRIARVFLSGSTQAHINSLGKAEIYTFGDNIIVDTVGDVEKRAVSFIM